jgi:excisionase family DNA binding protein
MSAVSVLSADEHRVGRALPDPEQVPLLSVDEVVAVFGGRLSRSAVYDAIHRGELPSVRLGRRVLVPTAALRRKLGLDVNENEAGVPAGPAALVRPDHTSDPHQRSDHG